MNPKLIRLLTTIATFSLVVITCSGCGDDPVEPIQPPSIISFSAQPSDIMPGDSSLVTYEVTEADEVRLLPGNISLTPVSSGELYVSPAIPTSYGLVASNKGGQDSASLTISMTGATPSIDLLRFQPDTILVGDSTVLEWRTTRADSIVIDQGLGRMAATDSGVVVVHPAAPTVYTAIAYNAIGTDTAIATPRVEVPFSISVMNGRHYKGVMGGGLQEPELSLRILDAFGRTLYLPSLEFSLIAGDGTLDAVSVTPDATGAILNDYQFDGQLGYGLVRARVPDVDSVDLKFRASVLRLGPDGQGQFVRFGDLYADVKALNSEPLKETYDDRPGYDLVYADYEASLGVVFAIFDANDDNIAQDTEPVAEIIVNTVYSEQTPQGIGIGSSIHDVRQTYGNNPDRFFHSPADQNNAEAWGLRYDSLGALFYASVIAPDSAIIEIHIWEPVGSRGAGEGNPKRLLRLPLPNSESRAARRFGPNLQL